MSQSAANASTLLNTPWPGGALIDRGRAEEVMDRLGLDGVAVALPVNIYHLTRYEGSLITRIDYPRHIALMPKNHKRPVALVMPSSQFYYNFSDVYDEQICQVYLVTETSDPRSQMRNDVPPEAGAVIMHPDRQFLPMDQLEAHRAATVGRAAKIRPFTTIANALSKAVKDVGLDRGKIGVDGPVAHQWMTEAAPTATLVDSAEAMARLRLVKSPTEIAIMRRVARANAEASLAAVRSIRAGATYRDLRAEFHVEAARRGNRGIWILVDRVISDGVEEKIRDGQSFLIDAVSTGIGYHGDYGRTVVVGEPAKPVAKATKAISAAWDAIRERLRPGLKFSDIKQIGVDALRGHDTTVRFTPHSVGLMHTDARELGDVTLEKGMIISVDCPVVEVGIGGSAHLEDLTLITEDGHETINDIGDKIIQV